MEHDQSTKGAKIPRRKKIACNFWLMLSALTLFACVGIKQTKMDSMNKINAANTTKVIGYFVPGRSYQLTDQIAWDKLSHVIFMYITPDANGIWDFKDDGKIQNLPEGNQPSDLIAKIKAKNPKIRILGSIWGSNEIVKWIDEEGERKRTKVISNLVSYLSDNGYDGADVDIEGSKITANWENFILETQVALKEKKMIFAGALAGWNQPNTTRKGAEAFDWINIMSYDEKGSWRPENPGQHSSIAGTRNAFQYFHGNGAGMDASRLAIGIPTYGYWFADDGKTAGGFAYSGVVGKNPAYADVDEFSENGQTWYYNGRPIVRQKVEMVKDWGANIMIFRLGTDAMNEYSILEEIGRTMDELGMTLD